MRVYMVQFVDETPAAVFDSLEAALAWAKANGYAKEYVIGPYVVNYPGDESPQWWEAGDA